VIGATRIIVTCGDVNGIGLECFVKAMQTSSDHHTVELIGNAATIGTYLQAAKLKAAVSNTVLDVDGRQIRIHDLDVAAPIELGELRTSSGIHAIAALEKAAELVHTGHADAVVTLPISKEACSLAGFPYPGQTEFFGARWGGAPLMVLAWQSMRVALATIHVPFRLVAPLLTPDHVSERIMALTNTVRMDHGIDRPRIAVLGLNPHAGESGTIGHEETDIIGPSVEVARTVSKGAIIEGPFAADGFFGFGMYREFDGILAMYHDQGLIPLKLLARGSGVNITAGLNHVRTSPDHGTAFSIAGQDKADPSSTLQAIDMAASIVARRRLTSDSLSVQG
jgi:4-hydroxythreonine-4-phosphate dehydrogenase